MIIETFILIKNANKISNKIQEIKRKENFVTTSVDSTDSVIDLLKTYLILIVVLIIIYLGLTIWALIDAGKNCTKLKGLHILLLIFLPGYLPLYFILRVSGVMCKKSVNYNY